jgi:hypothetical protein
LHIPQQAFASFAPMKDCQVSLARNDAVGESKSARLIGFHDLGLDLCRQSTSSRHLHVLCLFLLSTSV